VASDRSTTTGLTETTILLRESSSPIVRTTRNVYTKGRLLCLFLADGTVEKYPLGVVWRVNERALPGEESHRGK
jgi:hypothetical protein